MNYNNSANDAQRQRPGSAPVTKALTDSTTTEGDSQEPRQATPLHRSTCRLSLSYRWILPRSSNAQTYLGCMKDLQTRDHEARRSVGWKSLLNGLSKECAVTIRFASGALCTSLAIVQNSPDTLPKSLGLLTIILWLHGVSNSLALASFVDKLISDDELLERVTCRFQESDLVELANVFAIPQSSLIWCLCSTAFALMCYLKHGDTPILSSSVPRSRGNALDASGELLPANPGPGSLSPPVAVPIWAVVIAGIISGMVMIRFALVKRSLARVFNHDRKYDEEARVADCSVGSQSSTSIGPNSNSDSFSVAQAMDDCVDSLPNDSDCN